MAPPLHDLVDDVVDLTIDGDDGSLRFEPGWTPEPALPRVEPLRIVGEVLAGVGGLLLLFALFQLWGTGLVEWQAQRSLERDVEAVLVGPDRLAEPSPVAGSTAPDPGPRPVQDAAPLGQDRARVVPPALEPTGEVPPAPEPAPPVVGAAIGRISIPAIDLTKVLVEGVGRDELRTGPGHYPTTPLPGRPGNAAVAGHRTTHGAPFLRLDELEPGDVILVETAEGMFRYVVEGQPSDDGDVIGHRIVVPSEVWVIGPRGDDRLTLTACHPRYSARQRIVVTAVLDGEPALPPRDVEPAVLAEEAPPGTAGPFAEESPSGEAGPLAEDALPSGVGADVSEARPSGAGPLDATLGWRWEELDPALLWGTTSALVVHAGWIVARLWRRRLAYVLTVPAVAVPLFLCFGHLDRLLPAL